MNSDSPALEVNKGKDLGSKHLESAQKDADKGEKKGETSAPASKKRSISQITKDLDNDKVEAENSEKSSKKLKLETDPQSSAMVVISSKLKSSIVDSQSKVNKDPESLKETKKEPTETKESKTEPDSENTDSVEKEVSSKLKEL